MGKSTVDLPDPLQQPAPEPLAQAPGGVDDLLAQMAGEEIDRLLAESELPQDRATPAQPAAGLATAPAPAPTPISSPPAPPAVHASAADLDAAMTTEERAALEMPQELPAEEPPAADPFHVDEPDETVAEVGGLPLYLKPLEWLNAPLESLPEGARDAVGKIALLTFFNAAAVLIYVFVARKLHH
jgi:hypothetical protein